MKDFPVILIGGPPHSGKSVLAFSLTQALRAANIEHYLLRACPDGEGDWANLANPETVRLIRFKGEMTPEWVDSMCRDINNRHLPLLVDVGGKPKPWQEAIFSCCTQAILLAPDAGAQAAWRAIARRNGLAILADLRSSLNEPDVVWDKAPVLRGIIGGLERGTTAAGLTFQALLRRLMPLVTYQATQLRHIHLSHAPLEPAIDLGRLARTLAVEGDWRPEQLPAALEYLPQGGPLAVYGRGPNWLYAALALHSYPGPFYQFDPRLGWVAPLSLRIGAPPGNAALIVHRFQNETHYRFEIYLENTYLDYHLAGPLIAPPLPADFGLVFSGKLPLWLWTALARLYRTASWVGVYQPHLHEQAVVIASKTPGIRIGQLIAAPAKGG